MHEGFLVNPAREALVLSIGLTKVTHQSYLYSLTCKGSLRKDGGAADWGMGELSEVVSQVGRGPTFLELCLNLQIKKLMILFFRVMMELLSSPCIQKDVLTIVGNVQSIWKEEMKLLHY